MARKRRLGAGIDLREYGKVLFKRRWTVVAFFIIVVTIVTLGTFLQTPIYQAVSVIQILPEAPEVVDFKEVVALGSRNYWAMKEYYETQFRIIRSRDVVARVLDELELRDKAPYATARDPEALLADQILVQPVKNSQLVNIVVEHPNPELAQSIANAVAVVYQKQNLVRRAEASKNAIDWLREEGGDMRDRLVDSERKLQAFMKEAQVFSFDEKFNLALRNLAKFSEAQAEAKRKRIELETLYAKCVEMKAKGQASMIPEVMDSPVVQDLKSEKVAAEKKLAQLEPKYGEKYPEIQALKSQIALISAKINQEIEQHIGSIHAAYLVARDQETQMEKAVADARHQAQDLSEKEITFKELRRDAVANQTLYEELQKRAKETQITENLSANNILLIEKAQRPEFHVKPKRRVNIALGMLLGIIGGVGLAFFLEYLDNTIKTQQDIENITDIPFLGIIPTFMAEDGDVTKGELFTHYYPKSSITESCRAIRTNILYSSPGKELVKLLVTSAGPQEGKSTTVISLGTVFAQGGRRVCLVDSDLRRPRLHRAFKVERNKGLTNFIMGEMGVDEIAIPTEVPNLFLIPSGPIPPNPSELLESEPMKELMRQLEERFDMILFDSPPIVAVTDAIVLSRQVDGVVLVVKAGKTTTDMFDRAVRQIEDVKSHAIGSVLNDFNIRGEGYRYYYYYHYYRSDEDGSADPTKRRRTRKRTVDEIRKSA